jgi:hypothetical protein
VVPDGVDGCHEGLGGGPRLRGGQARFRDGSCATASRMARRAWPAEESDILLRVRRISLIASRHRESEREGCKGEGEMVCAINQTR